MEHFSNLPVFLNLNGNQIFKNPDINILEIIKKPLVAFEMQDNPLKINPKDKNMQNPVLFLEGQTSEKVIVWAKIRQPPLQFPARIGKNLKIMRFAPADMFTDMFIWLNTTTGQSFEVFVDFGSIPDPDKLLFREKITLPSSKFLHEYSVSGYKYRIFKQLTFYPSVHQSFFFVL